MKSFLSWLREKACKWVSSQSLTQPENSPSAFDQFFTLSVADICVPRSDIVAIDVKLSFQEALDAFLKTNVQVLPVYRETLDHIVGVIHIRQLLSLSDKKDTWNRHLSPTAFIPSTANVKEAFHSMIKRHKNHLLFIVDEHGGIEGLLTKNHILSELSDHCFGDTEEEISMNQAALPVISGRMDLEAFEEEFDAKGLFSPDDEDKVNTVGGWLCVLLGRMPTKGEVIQHPSGFVFEITKTDPRKIHEITILKMPQPPQPKPE